MLAVVAAAAGCRTVRPSPLAHDCTELDAARARVIRTDGKLYQVTLTRDQLIVASCGTPAEQTLLRESLRSEGKPARYRQEQWTAERLNKQMGEDPHGIAFEGRRWCHDDPQCALAVVVDDGVEPGAAAPATNSFSTTFNCALVHSTAAHFDLTFKAMRDSGFSEEQARLAATAAQDVDDFEATHAAAHAQTPSAKGGALFEQPPAEARTAFIRWSQCQLKRLSDACTKPAEERLYWLGYALHGVQDLAFHQGISNAEHAYRDAKLGEGVDCALPERQAWAAAASSQLVTAALARMTPTCGAEMKVAVNVKVTPDLRARLGRASDRAGFSLPDYFFSAHAFATVLEDHADQSDQFKVSPHWVTVSPDERARGRDVGAIVNEIAAPPAGGDPCAPAR